MQAYGSAFAQVYNMLWTNFSRSIAPQIYDVYNATEIASQHQTMLDLCCGTGQLSLYFLQRGYHVTGIDLSEAMLEHARDNASMFVQAGQAHFLRGDAANYTLDEPVGLAVSTYDALNHLPNLDALRGCFSSTYQAVLPGGMFIFDLNTRLGLQRWNGINVSENPDSVVITRGLYDGGEKAYTRVSGFVRLEKDERYTRFEETVFNTAFDIERVGELLQETGWQSVTCARENDLTTAISEPEQAGRVFLIAQR